MSSSAWGSVLSHQAPHQLLGSRLAQPSPATPHGLPCRGPRSLALLPDRFAIFALTVACETPASTPAPWVPKDRSLCGVDITQAYVAAASDPSLSHASSP